MLAALAAIMVAAAVARSHATEDGIPQGYVLEMADEMDGRSLDRSLWTTRFERWNIRHLEGNGDRGLKVADDDIIRHPHAVASDLEATSGHGGPFLHEVSKGTLKLRAFPLADDLHEAYGFPWLASMISGEGRYARRFGYWQLRVRINAIGRGQHVAFWLLPDDGGWPPEIDLLEIVGDDRRLYANMHLADPDEVPPISSLNGDASLAGWMDIGFLWTPERMRWTINGEIVRDHPAPRVERPMHLLVSWEIGSRWPGEPDASTPWPGEVEIDHVRVWRPPATGELFGGD